MLIPWHAQERDVILHRLGADAERGLAPAESTRRLREHGPNALSAAGGSTGPGWPARTRLDVPALLLFLAAALCAQLGELIAAAVIVAVAAANVVLGSRRERAAWRGGEALARLSAPSARVVRGGKSFLIPAAELVPGDLAEVRTGDRVPADVRLIRARQLIVDESALTGGSLPIGKDAGQLLPERTAVAERSNMLFAGTLVTAGEGAGVVIATGMRTELGRIARLLGGATAPQPPLRGRLGDLGQVLALAVCAAALVAALRLWGGARDALLAAVATLAVAGVPVALPACVALALASGARRLGRGGAIVRTPATAETLGGVSVIVTDKTGILSRDEMTVRELLLEDELIEVTGNGFAPEGRILRGGDAATAADWETLAIALRAGAQCSSAALSRDEEGAWRVDGDPVEGALLTLAAKGGVWRDDLEREHPRLAAFPATVERRRMTVLVAGRGARPTALTKGDPDAVLALCLHHRTAAGVRPLSPADRERILQRAEEMGGRALHVVGLAYRDEVSGLDARAVERSLVWAGLAGMFDPPREEIAAAVADGLAAGILPVIVTGDRREAASELAREVGALGPGDEAITGEELDLLTPEALGACVERYRVCARANAGHKLRLVRAWKSRGHRVAMIGAEVSDAPALREADIGVALGRGGNEIAREEAALRIAEGGFASVVAAVLEGGRVREVLSRLSAFLLALTAAGMLVVLAATLFALPQPLTPLRLLWIAVTAGLPPALVLALSAPAAVPPRGLRRAARGNPLAGEWSAIVLNGGAGIALVALAAVLYARLAGAADAPHVGAHALAALGLSAPALAFGCRRPVRSAAAPAEGTNRWLFVGVVCSWTMAAAAVRVAPLAGVLGIATLGQGELLRVFLLAPLPLLLVVGSRAWRQSRREP